MRKMIRMIQMTHGSIFILVERKREVRRVNFSVFSSHTQTFFCPDPEKYVIFRLNKIKLQVSCGWLLLLFILCCTFVKTSFVDYKSIHIHCVCLI